MKSRQNFKELHRVSGKIGGRNEQAAGGEAFVKEIQEALGGRPAAVQSSRMVNTRSSGIFNSPIALILTPKRLV